MWSRGRSETYYDMAVAKRLGRLTADCCYFFLCDVQDKFRPSIRYFPEIIAVAKRMVSGGTSYNQPHLAIRSTTPHYTT